MSTKLLLTTLLAGFAFSHAQTTEPMDMLVNDVVFLRSNSFSASRMGKAIALRAQCHEQGPAFTCAHVGHGGP